MSPAFHTRLARRKRRNRLLAACGAGSVILTLLWVIFLFASLSARAWPAMTTTQLRVTLELDATRISREDPRRGDWRGVLREGLARLTPAEAGPEAAPLITSFVSPGAVQLLRTQAARTPEIIGTRQTFWLPVSDALDQYRKGLLAPEAGSEALVSPAAAALFDQLLAEGTIRTRFAWGFFTNADSRFPSLAGLAGSAIGSLMAIVICFLVAFPIGVAAAIWFEEFAPRARTTDMLRINVYNLAAIPSVIFGLLGLAVFLNTFGLARGSPLVGGLVLGLMTLPVIIVVSSSAIAAVPRDIRDAALALGASRQEAVQDHMLPYALPGILTGTIIGLARAFGETAPLLLIGMNAFLPSVPGSITDAATALPSQIFLWSDQPERGFAARTSAAILVLLILLMFVNLTAILMRHRFERRART